MNGSRNGVVISDKVIQRLSSYINRNNASIIQNEWAEGILNRTKDGAQFVRFKDGSAAILLRQNATKYQLVHELKHYEHWLADPVGYARLSKLAREEFVFEKIQLSNHWQFFSPSEQDHAVEYMNYIRRLYKP